MLVMRLIFFFSFFQQMLQPLRNRREKRAAIQRVCSRSLTLTIESLNLLWGYTTVIGWLGFSDAGGRGNKIMNCCVGLLPSLYSIWEMWLILLIYHREDCRYLSSVIMTITLHGAVKSIVNISASGWGAIFIHWIW